MALTPERIAELERLKAMLRPAATEAQRKAQAMMNAEQMANKKAGGGKISADMRPLKFMDKPSIVPYDVAQKINMQTSLPTSPEFITAVQNTAGSELTPEGLKMSLQRFQKPEQSGDTSVRQGVFYLPKGSANVKHYKKPNTGYGGTEEIAGDTLVRNPLFAKGATGGKAPEAAFDMLMGKGATKKLADDIMKVVVERNKGIQEEKVANLLNQYGMDPDDAWHIVRNSSQGNQLRYALQERIIGHHARKAGHDAILGYSKGRGGKGEFLSELFDLREADYPTKQGGYRLNPEFEKARGGRVTHAHHLEIENHAQGGTVNPFDYENPEHVSTVAGHAVKHKDFKVYDPKLIGEVLSTGHHQHLEDPRMLNAMRQAGHDAYHVLEKTGKKLHKMQAVVKKAMGGTVEQMRQELQAKGKMTPDISQIGAEEAPSMPVKDYVVPNNGATGSLPMGGVDMSPQQPGQQMLPANLLQPQQPQGDQGAPQGQPSPLGSTGSPPPAGGSNILQMTQQGQALNAMKPPMPQMAVGGPVPVMNRPFQASGDRPLPFMAKEGGSDNAPMNNDYSDNGATDFSIDNIQQLNDGGQPKVKKQTVAEMKQAIFEKAQQGLMKPSEALARHEGKYMHITEADRAKVEKRKHGMRGGVGFSQIGLEDPDYAGRVWGVGKSGTAIKLLNRQRRGLSPDDQSIYTTFIGTPEMHTSNQLVFNRMYNKFMEARKAGLLSPEQEAEMLDIMRSAMTKGTEKKPGKAIFDPNVTLDNTHHLFDTFERRRILSDLMAGKKIGGKKAQIFDASKMIEDTTDPRLLHAPTFSVGPHTFSFNGETSYEPHLNKAFPFMLHGEAHPEAFQQIPFAEAAPDFTNEIRKAKGREPGYMDIVRRIPRQQITEKYLTGLQKIGKKKGGAVNKPKVTDNLDTMRLALTRKKKAAK